MKIKESRDFSHHPWFKRQYDWFRGTTLPNFYMALGFADASTNWFYGPEAQEILKRLLRPFRVTIGLLFFGLNLFWC